MCTIRKYNETAARTSKNSNTKIGMRTKGNIETVVQSGWQLMQLVYKEEIIIVNEQSEICKEFWTRGELNEKSVIDYALTMYKR